MKKKLLTGALALILLAGGLTAAFSVSQSETLVSLGYLSGAFWNDLKATVKQEVDRDTTAILNEAAAQAGQGGGSAFAARGPPAPASSGPPGAPWCTAARWWTPHRGPSWPPAPALPWDTGIWPGRM